MMGLDGFVSLMGGRKDTDLFGVCRIGVLMCGDGLRSWRNK